MFYDASRSSYDIEYRRNKSIARTKLRQSDTSQNLNRKFVGKLGDAPTGVGVVYHAVFISSWDNAHEKLQNHICIQRRLRSRSLTWVVAVRLKEFWVLRYPEGGQTGYCLYKKYPVYDVKIIWPCENKPCCKLRPRSSLALWSSRLGNRELLLAHCIFFYLICVIFCPFLFLLMSWVGCGLWLWYSLNLSFNLLIKTAYYIYLCWYRREDPHCWP